MKLSSTVGLAILFAGACAPHPGARPAQPAQATAESCEKTAELLAERSGLLDDMNLTRRERAQLESSLIRTSQPMPRNGATAGSLAAVSLGDVQGIKQSGQVALGNPASSNPVYMRQTTWANPKEFLLLRLRTIDEKLSKLPARQDCMAAHLTD